MKKCSARRLEMNSKKSSNLGIFPDFQTPPPPPPNPFYNNINNQINTEFIINDEILLNQEG